jgi:DNA-binding XRE family transcriptional regulator
VTKLEQQEVKNIDNAIVVFLNEKQMKREELAKALGISTASLLNKRKGNTEWLWSEILTLSSLLGKTPDELAGIVKV